MRRLTFGLLMLGLTASVSAQHCVSSIPKSHPDDQYISNNNGTVTDVRNGLMWMQCSLGQTFKDGNCHGGPVQFDTWKEALDAAQANNTFADHNDWRLPNIKELADLVERSCADPAINLHHFHGTPPAPYWSNTYDAPITDPDTQQPVVINPGALGRLIDFTDGSEFIKEVTKHRFIRLVRQSN